MNIHSCMKLLSHIPSEKNEVLDIRSGIGLSSLAIDTTLYAQGTMK